MGVLTTWLNIAGSNSIAFAIKTDGTLWSWGYNGTGELGVGDIANRSSPTQIGALTTWSKIAVSSAIKTDGTLWTWGQNASGKLGLGNVTNYSSPKQVGALTTWLTIAGGYDFTLAISTT